MNCSAIRVYMNLAYISELPCNSVIYVSMYRGYTNVYSLYKSISLSNVLVFLLTRVRYVYVRVQFVTRALTTLTITITITYVHKRTMHHAHAQTNTRFSLYVTYRQHLHKRASQRTHTPSQTHAHNTYGLSLYF